MSKQREIDELEVDLSLIGRNELDEDAVEIYRDLMANGWNKPITVQKDTGLVVDGAHRIAAAKKLGKAKISVKEKDVPDEDLRLEAYKYNKKHGVQYTKGERNKIIMKLYTEDGKTQQEIADVFGLSQRAIGKIIKNISNRKSSNTNKTDKRETLTEDQERTVALLAIKGEKQQDLAEKFGIAQPRVSQIRTDYIQEIRKRYRDGEGRLNIATSLGLDPEKLDEILVSSTDSDPLDFQLPITTWWEAYGLDDRQERVPGSVPVQLVKNLLALFTQPGDHMVDPFAGGGITKIACDDMVGRTYELFDFSPAVDEVERFSIVDREGNVFLPPVDTVPDFVFLDPPYGSQKKGEYSKDGRDLSNLELDRYIEVISSFLMKMKDEWSPVKIGLLMSSQREKNRIYDLPSTFSTTLKNQGYTILDHIVNRVNRPQSATPQMVESAKENRWLMREHIHIIVGKMP